MNVSERDRWAERINLKGLCVSKAQQLSEEQVLSLKSDQKNIRPCIFNTRNCIFMLMLWTYLWASTKKNDAYFHNFYWFSFIQRNVWKWRFFSVVGNGYVLKLLIKRIRSVVFKPAFNSTWNCRSTLRTSQTTIMFQFIIQ